MPFNAVIMPEVSVNDMRGVLALLELIGNPQSKAAADFLAKLSAEKDAAVEAAAKAASDTAVAAASLEEARKLRDETETEMQRVITESKMKIAQVESVGQNLAEDSADLKNRQAAHAAAVQEHKNKMAAREAEILSRETALVAREQKLERDTADLARKQAAFDQHMAPIVAAAKLVTG